MNTRRASEMTVFIHFNPTAESITCTLWDWKPLPDDIKACLKYQRYTSEGKTFHVLMTGKVFSKQFVIGILNAYKRGEWKMVSLNKMAWGNDDPMPAHRTRGNR